MVTHSRKLTFSSRYRGVDWLPVLLAFIVISTHSVFGYGRNAIKLRNHPQSKNILPIFLPDKHNVQQQTKTIEHQLRNTGWSSVSKVSNAKRWEWTILTATTADATESLTQRNRSISNKKTSPLLPILIAATKKPQMQQIEMVTMSTAGAALIMVLLYTVAGTGEADLDALSSTTVESFEVASYNIIEAALPLRMSEALSIAIGEAIAGFIGAIVTFVLSTRLQWKSNRNFRDEKVTEAVADGDFLLTQAAAIPILEAIGLSPTLARTVSIGIAILPSSLVKLRARQRQQMIEEEKILQKYLKEQQEKEKAENVMQKIASTVSSFISRPVQMATSTVDVRNLVSVQAEKNLEARLDAVEIFSDVLKWLQFNVLSSELGGDLIVPEQIYLIPGGESAFFGTIATLSSQLYADLLYGYFGLGGEKKRDMVRYRTPTEWFTIYLYKTIYAAVLFGVYAIVQIPARIVVNAFLSGGVNGCIGSEDVKACIQGYIELNPPGASPEGQLRSLATAIYSILYNLGLPDAFPF